MSASSQVGTQQSSGGSTAGSSLAPNSIFDRSLAKSKHEVSLSLFAFLFSEAVQYSMSQSKQGYRLEDKLHELGVRVGYRVLDLLVFREKNKREIHILPMLKFVSQVCWKYLFGHPGVLLEGLDQDYEYMINDKSLLVNKFISAPRDYGHVNCGAYVAGIVEGILCSGEFPAEVTAHTVEDTPTQKSTTILIKFLPEVMAREKK
eukprot:GHVS01028634.1.p1 GENE.GHVS01028634.1~~GHVS01028634.1.p1  ORF type:complete len:204 (-),score=16.78 GHVS01028634.1:455-1066(-)